MGRDEQRDQALTVCRAEGSWPWRIAEVKKMTPVCPKHPSHLLQRTGRLAGGHVLSDLCHPGGKGTPILGQLNGLHGRAQDPDPVPSEHPSLGQLHAAVQSCLAPERQQHTIWALVTYHLMEERGITGRKTGAGAGQWIKEAENRPPATRVPCLSPVPPGSRSEGLWEGSRLCRPGPARSAPWRCWG